jgi:hypothetical protein
VGVKKNAIIPQLVRFPLPLIPSHQGRGEKLSDTLKEGIYMAVVPSSLGVKGTTPPGLGSSRLWLLPKAGIRLCAR